ncbi:hypothetical protein NUITMVS1_01330 [Shewanella xiamenensis]|nr:hypothetical protein NUITMVS1_01330 [Shewanella xiamenensis]
MYKLKDTPCLTGLSTDMEVTVGGMDAAVEHTRTYLLRVTEMTVLNRSPLSFQTQSLPAFDCGLTF